MCARLNLTHSDTSIQFSKSVRDTCPSGQWTADEATCEQTGKHLLLPSTTVVPTPELCDPERNVTSCDMTHLTAHRQLQLRSRYFSNVNDRTSIQRVQNTAACLALVLDRSAHITPALKKLHWLPVRHRITFKIDILMHRTGLPGVGDGPIYLRDVVHFVNTDSNRIRPRSATTRGATTVRTRTISSAIAHFPPSDP